jgi:hypothetical protein
MTAIIVPLAPSITAHIKRLRAMPCMISGSKPVTLHHCKGGSMRELLGCAGSPGGGRKVSDWLQIPIAERYHTGQFGIDNGMGIYKSKEMWETAFGKQSDFLIRLSRELGYNVFERAGFRVIISGMGART